MGETIEDMDVEIEQKDNRKKFLENKKGFPGGKILETMNNLGVKRISSKRKRNSIMDRLNDSPNNHKYILKKL